MMGRLLTSATILVLLQSFLDATVSASPKVLSLGFEKKNAADRASSGLRRRAQTNPVSTTLTNVQDVFYYVNISLGTPAQEFAVVLDTGSSDLWVLSNEASICAGDAATYCPYGTFDASSSSTFVDVLQDGFNITYLLGDSDTGDIVNDTLRIGDVTLKQTTFGLVTSAASTDDMGIMGVGYVAGESTVETDDAVYPNFVESLYDRGYIESRAFSLWLDNLTAKTGTVLFGGIDTTKYTGSLTAIPIHKDVFSGIIDSYDVPLTSITFQSNSSSTPSSNFIATDTVIPVTLDSGSTDIILPNDVAASLYLGLGATMPYATSAGNDTAVLPCSIGESSSTLNFQFAGSAGPSIAVPISEFITPLTDENGNTISDPVTGVAICQLGIDFSDDGPCLLGDAFLRSAYVVYDIDLNQVALAQASFDNSGTNIVQIPASGIPHVSSTATGFPATTPVTGFAGAQTDAAVRSSAVIESEFVKTQLATPTFELGLSSKQSKGVESASSATGKSTGSSSGSSSTSSSTSAAVPAAGILGGSRGLGMSLGMGLGAAILGAALLL